MTHNFHGALGRWARQSLCLMSLAALAACGGGGGGSAGEADVPPAATDPSMQAAIAPATLPGNFRALSAIPEATVNTAAAGLPASGGTAYLKVWVVSAETGEVDVLALVRWAPPQALPGIQAPATAAAVQFEIYNDAGSVTGEWGVQ